GLIIMGVGEKHGGCRPAAGLLMLSGLQALASVLFRGSACFCFPRGISLAFPQAGHFLLQCLPLLPGAGGVVPAAFVRGCRGEVAGAAAGARGRAGTLRDRDRGARAVLVPDGDVTAPVVPAHVCPLSPEGI